MRKNLLYLGLVLLIAVLVTSVHAATKTYQFTGVVKTVQGTTFTVEKSPKEIWDFSTDAATKGAPKTGDKVTVFYRMVATDIEAKPSTAPVKK